MQINTNFLKITAWTLLIIGIVLFIPSWGGTIVLIGISLVIFLLNFLLKNKPTKLKNRITILFWLGAFVFTYFQTRQIHIYATGKPQRIFVVSGMEDKPEILSWWKWQNKITVDSTNVIYTSTKGDKIDLDYVKIYDENGKSIGNRGGGKLINNCNEAKSTLFFQTVYLFDETNDLNEPKESENNRYSELSEWQSNRCKNGR